MDRARFEEQFLRATAEARDLARTFIEEPLPDAMRFRVQLNASYDGHATPDFRLYPEDSSPAKPLENRDLDAQQVVDLLWREGRLPQWIDVQVVDETGTATVMDVVCCGRFTDDEDRVYYAARGTGPFGPKGPTLPPRHIEGRRFSIHHRAHCWSIEDLARASVHREKVAFLTLHGPVFDDAVLATIATFSLAHLLEVGGAPVAGPGLICLARFPRLRFLRVRVAAIPELSLHALPATEAVESIDLTGLPPRISSVARLAAAAPKLRKLTLGSSVQTSADGQLVHEGLDELVLRFPNVPDWVSIPASLCTLRLHAPEASDADVKRLLASCPDSLESVGLRGTPVSDAVIEELERMQVLQYVDAANTRITADALRGLARGRPRFKWWPRI